MKTIIYLLSILLFSSCMVALPVSSNIAKKSKIKKYGKGQTHNEIMSELKTKKDVIKSFGVATEKYNEEGIEIWVYNYGTVIRSDERISLNDNARVNVNLNNISGNSNVSGSSNKITSSYKKFVEIQFDELGDVISWRSKGVDKSWNNHSEILKLRHNPGFAWLIGLCFDMTLFFMYLGV